MPVMLALPESCVVVAQTVGSRERGAAGVGDSAGIAVRVVSLPGLLLRSSLAVSARPVAARHRGLTQLVKSSSPFLIGVGRSEEKPIRIIRPQERPHDLPRLRA